jgi:pyridoxal phosphate enzyme (YggS family)
MSISDNVKQIRSKINKISENRKRNSGEVTIIGVTKSVDTLSAKELILSGITNIAENRVQEFVKKEEELKELIPETNFTMHHIGHLQKNKIKYLLKSKKLNLIQAIDSEKIANSLNLACKANDIIVDTLLEVKTSGEETKFGIDPEEVFFLSEILSKCENIRVKGLMTMAPFTNDKALIRSSFDIAWDIYNELKNKEYNNFDIKYLSMGMSGDFEEAILAGSNMVRIGRSFFI